MRIIKMEIMKMTRQKRSQISLLSAVYNLCRQPAASKKKTVFNLFTSTLKLNPSIIASRTKSNRLWINYYLSCSIPSLSLSTSAHCFCGDCALNVCRKANSFGFVTPHTIALCLSSTLHSTLSENEICTHAMCWLLTEKNLTKTQQCYKYVAVVECREVVKNNKNRRQTNSFSIRLISFHILDSELSGGKR